MERLESLINELGKDGAPDIKKLNALKRNRNQLFYLLHKGEFPDIPVDVLKIISSYTSPKDVESLGSVKTWARAATRKEQILSINTGLKLKHALPPKITTAKQVLEWLKKDREACQGLTYADIRDFEDFSNENLDELIDICPSLTHLLFKSYSITQVQMLPANLQVLKCDCFQLATLPELPPTLKKLICSYCTRLATLPELPAKLQELGCDDCPQLAALPILPASLQQLNCSNCARLAALPELPAALKTLTCLSCYQLAALPELPVALQKLYCRGCTQLAALPELPAALQVLDCHDCPQLATLPKLPAS